MKSREGKVVDADDLISDIKALSAAELKVRYKKLSKKELDARATKIALGAIKYMLLSLEPVKDIMFDPTKAVSFEGETGPYIQYTYARARAILRKSKKKGKHSKAQLGEKETDIVKLIAQYPWIVRKACQEMKPSHVANYLFELATLFNEFYHSSKVIGSEKEKELLVLVSAVATVLKDGLSLLGIDVLEEM